MELDQKRSELKTGMDKLDAEIKALEEEERKSYTERINFIREEGKKVANAKRIGE